MKVKGVVSSIKVLVIFSITGLFIACGGGGSTPVTDDEVTRYEGEMFAVSAGTTLKMYGIDSGGDVSELSSVALPPEGLLSIHGIFDIKKHPSQPWLYVTSLNECSDGEIGCWGNARIDRFSYNAFGVLQYEGLAFNYTTDSGPDCVNTDWGYTGQIGACAPTTIAFSADGTRLYADDDELDGVQIFGVGSSGNLTFIWEGANTNRNGLAVSPSGTHLYNGSNVIELTSDTASDIVEGTGGNATEIVTNSEGANLMVTTQFTRATNELAIYDLADQAAPSLIDSLVLDDAPVIEFVNGGSARFQASSNNLSQFVVVGVESVATISFDGSTFTLQNQLFDTDDTIDVINRSVAVTNSGGRALVSWFKPYDAAGDPLLTGGLTLYSIAADGTLTLDQTFDYTTPSRAVLAVPAL